MHSSFVYFDVLAAFARVVIGDREAYRGNIEVKGMLTIKALYTDVSLIYQADKNYGF